MILSLFCFYWFHITALAPLQAVARTVFSVTQGQNVHLLSIIHLHHGLHTFENTLQSLFLNSPATPFHV
jgi:hypothetical protein